MPHSIGASADCPSKSQMYTAPGINASSSGARREPMHSSISPSLSRSPMAGDDCRFPVVIRGQPSSSTPPELKACNCPQKLPQLVATTTSISSSPFMSPSTGIDVTVDPKIEIGHPGANVPSSLKATMLEVPKSPAMISSCPSLFKSPTAGAAYGVYPIRWGHPSRTSPF